MRKIKWLDARFEETLLVIFLAAVCVVELAQVVIRKIPFIPALTWAEEFCRFLWIWSVFISLPYTIRNGTMLRVTLLRDLLPQRARNAVDIFVDAAILVSMALCAFHSVAVVEGIAKSGETSPAMLWPMWFVYGFMLFGFALGALRGVQRLIMHIVSFRGKDKSAAGDMCEEPYAAKEKGDGV